MKNRLLPAASSSVQLPCTCSSIAAAKALLRIVEKDPAVALRALGSEAA